MPSGTTGDIIWRRTDPKTWELSNRPSPPEEVGLESPAQGWQPSAKAASDQERALMQQMMAAQPEYSRREIASQASPKQKREWRKQLRTFDKYLKQGGEDAPSGIQELLDSGAMWYDEDGWYTSVALPHGEKARQRFVDAADAWGDRVGIWKNGQFDPGAEQTYRKNLEQRVMEERSYGSPNP